MGGLFGAPRRLPQVAPGVMDAAQPYADVRFPAPQPQQQQEKPYWQTTSGKLALAGQIIGQHGRGAPNPMLELAAQEQQMRSRMQLAQQQRQWGNEDWLQRETWQRAHPMPRVNDTVEDYNFLTQHLGPEAGQTFLRNRADPPQYRQGPDGQFYRIETATPSAPVGRLTPIEPTMQNTPAPQVGANGMPTVLTRAQYQAVVAAKGQQATDEWAQRFNVQIRD